MRCKKTEQLLHKQHIRNDIYISKRGEPTCNCSEQLGVESSALSNIPLVALLNKL